MAPRRYRIVVCRGPDCGDRHGSAALHEVFRSALEAHQRRDVDLAWQSCFGRCKHGPNVLVRELIGDEGDLAPTLGTGFATAPAPRGAAALYHRVDAAGAERIVTEHILCNRIVRSMTEQPADASGVRYSVPVASTMKDS